MDKKFTKAYKEKYENFSETPPDSAWRAVSDALEMDRKLARNNKLRISAIIAALSLIFIIAGFYGFEILNSKLAPKTNPIARMNLEKQLLLSNIESPKNIRESISANASSTQKNKRHNIKGIAGKGKKIKMQSHELTAHSGRPIRNYTLNASKKAKENGHDSWLRNNMPAQPKSVNLGTPIVASSISEQESLEIKKIDRSAQLSSPKSQDKMGLMPFSHYTFIRRQEFYRRFFVGLAFSLNNSWIVNSNLQSANNQNSLDYIQPVFNTSIGLAAGYQMKGRKAVISEFFYNSAISQNYMSYSSGLVHKNELSLNYTQMNLMMAFNSIGRNFGKFNIHSVLYSGFHLGYLTSATEQVDESAQSVYHDYRKFNLGVITGAGYALTWNNRITLMVSARLNFGVNNVYAGNGYVPVEFNKTFNEVISGGAGLFYHF